MKNKLDFIKKDIQLLPLWAYLFSNILVLFFFFTTLDSHELGNNAIYDGLPWSFWVLDADCIRWIENICVFNPAHIIFIPFVFAMALFFQRKFSSRCLECSVVY